MGFQKNWTNSEGKQAQAHYDKRLSDGVSVAQIFREIAIQLDRSSDAVGHRFKRSGRSFIGKYREPARKTPRARIKNQVHHVQQIPREVIAERNRAALLGHPSVTSVLCGDPLPGRSALDRLKSVGES